MMSNNNMMVKTRIRSTAAQLKLLTEYMTANPHMARCQAKGPQGRIEELNEWERLRFMLKDHGPDKSVDQWKVTWRDLRRKALKEGNSSFPGAIIITTNTIGVGADMSDSSENILGDTGPDTNYEDSCGDESNTVEISVTPLIKEEAMVEEEEAQEEQVVAEPILWHTAQSPEQSIENEPIQNQVMKPIRVTDFNHDSMPQPRRPIRLRSDLIRSRRELRARTNQFLEAKVETKNVLKDVVHQLQIANRLSATKSRLAYKDKLWRLRKDLFK